MVLTLASTARSFHEFLHAFGGTGAMTLSVNTGSIPGCTSEISDFSTSLFASSATPSYAAHSLAIFTNNSCHLTSAVISGWKLVACDEGFALLTHDTHSSYKNGINQRNRAFLLFHGPSVGATFCFFFLIIRREERTKRKVA